MSNNQLYQDNIRQVQEHLAEYPYMLWIESPNTLKFEKHKTTTECSASISPSITVWIYKDNARRDQNYKAVVQVTNGQLPCGMGWPAGFEPSPEPEKIDYMQIVREMVGRG